MRRLGVKYWGLAVLIVGLIGSCQLTNSSAPRSSPESTSTPSLSVSNAPSASTGVTSPGPLTPNPSQPLEGSSWRFLGATSHVASPASIRVALNHAEFLEIWADLFPGSTAPTVDFGVAVVVDFNLLVEAACPDLILTRVESDETQRLVYGVFVNPPSACSDIAGSQTIVVAVQRSALPVGSVTFRNMLDYQLCVDCGRETEAVTVDL